MSDTPPTRSRPSGLTYACAVILILSGISMLDVLRHGPGRNRTMATSFGSAPIGLAILQAPER